MLDGSSGGAGGRGLFDGFMVFCCGEGDRQIGQRDRQIGQRDGDSQETLSNSGLASLADILSISQNSVL